MKGKQSEVGEEVKSIGRCVNYLMLLAISQVELRYEAAWTKGQRGWGGEGELVSSCAVLSHW